MSKLEARQQAAEQINKMFGLNIKVSVNSLYTSGIPTMMETPLTTGSTRIMIVAGVNRKNEFVYDAGKIHL